MSAQREAQTWLKAQSREGRRGFRLAAMWSAVATLALLLQLTGVARFLGAAFTGHGRTSTPSVILVLGASVARFLALRAASISALDGSRAVVDSIRQRLLRRVFTGSQTLDSPAATADTVVEQTGRLAGYYERFEPLRLAVGVECALMAAAAFAVNWVVAVMLLLATPFVPVNMAVVGMGADTVSRRQLQQIRELSATVLDRIRALPMLSGLDAVEDQAGHLERTGTELRVRTMKVLRLALLSSSVLDLVSTFAIAVVATYVGLVLLGFVHTSLIPDHFTLTQAMFLLLITPAYFAPLRSFAAAYHDRANAVAAAGVIAPALKGKADASLPDAGPVVAVDAPIGILFRDVTVRYPGRSEPALRHVSLDVAAGSVVAVVGASGAGKSTLLAVAAGVLAPTQGTVQHVDRFGRARPPDVADVAWGSQRPVLFRGSLADNITLGAAKRTDGESRRALQGAIDDAGLHEVIALRPGGLDTELSQEGEDLSGGERQRLSVARALYKDARVLVLDEPTAHLDAATEGAVLQVLRRVLAGRTALIATHSPAVLALADVVVSLDDGRLQPAVPATSEPVPAPIIMNRSLALELRS